MQMAQGPFYCRDLISSGSDDTAMISAFCLFVPPLGMRLLRFGKPVGFAEFLLLICCQFLALAALALASLDCAEILYTALRLPDPLLAAALLCLPLSLAALIALRFK